MTNTTAINRPLAIIGQLAVFARPASRNPAARFEVRTTNHGGLLMARCSDPETAKEIATDLWKEVEAELAE